MATMNTKAMLLRVLGCSSAHFNYVLKGDRNLGVDKAKIAAIVTDTDIEIWMLNNHAQERQSAFNSWEETVANGIVN